MTRLTSTGQADIVWCQNEDLEVHHIAESTLNDGMDALEDDNRGSLDSLCDIGSLVQGEVIRWDLTVLTRDELIDLLISEIKVKSIWMVEVVVCSILMFIISIVKEQNVLDYRS